jgi:glycyl-tRNA synthetase beta chain
MPDLLIEVLSEEIPARMQVAAAEGLLARLGEMLGAEGLVFASSISHVTPRRVVLGFQGLPERQPDLKEERRGPREGAPEQALAGFLKANGLDGIEQAELRETDKGRFYFAVREVAGRAAAEVLPELICAVLREFTWPKSMRWGAGSFRWVRPVHSLLVLFGGQPLAGALDLGGGTEIAFSGESQGHRFLAPEPFAVTSLADLEDKLRAAKVLLDREARRRTILEQAEAAARRAGLALRDDPGLLEEVVGLVEWPVVMIGRIEPAFMTLPPEVLTTSMRSHQKYFALGDSDGRLADRFLLVANTEVADPSVIVAGNERVLRARLSDARFFWDHDRARSLESRVADLEAIVFHARLGTLAEKVARIEDLSHDLARLVPGANADLGARAARLAKADLTTGMVGEFPELQGVTGRYYALHDGEPEAVAAAIAEHYAPLGPSDACPDKPISVVVALADKLDTLVGFFAIGETPTGSKDPFALRRAALGLIRLIVENQLRIPLAALIDSAYGRYQLDEASHPGRALIAFIADRLKVALRDQGVRHDLVSAVFAAGEEDDLVRLLERVRALEAFLSGDDGANLMTAYRRAANIVRIEEKKDQACYRDEVDGGLLDAAEERALFAALGSATEAADRALEEEDFAAAMAALADTRQPVDLFFDKVTVNADQPALRANRLRLLSRIGATLDRVADFSMIEG